MVLEITSNDELAIDSLLPGRWRTDSLKASPVSVSSILCGAEKKRNEAIKIQSAFAPAIRFSPVIILGLLLFVSFGTWFPSRSARVGAVWHMAAVRVLYRDRRHRVRNLLKQEIERAR